MQSEQPYSGVAASSREEEPPFRYLGDPPMLLALAAIALGAVALALLLAPRLLTPQPPTEDSPEVGFTRDMIVHHGQAVEMADIVQQRTESEEIRALATDILLSQQGEIGRMQGWLGIWGLPASGLDPPMTWMGHPTSELMPGMATPEEINQLRQAPPEEADEQFVRLMIPHHQSAVEMAEAIQERTDQPEVARFAQKTIAAQQAEIANMQAWLEREGLAPVESDVSMPQSAEEGHHGEGQGFTGSVPETARDTARLSPIAFAVLAIAWLSTDAIRRRRVWAGFTEAAASPPSIWQALAVGGLGASAALHMGLAPAHFAEATSHGVFFLAASVGLAVVAGVLLAWPSRPAYIAGAVISVTLILLWALFRIVPPPGAEVAEEVDLVGLFTKATELLAAVGCIRLWLRAPNVDRLK